MKKVHRAVAAVAIACALPTPAFAEVRLHPGKWRVQAESVTNGVADPSQDEEVCLRDELKDLAGYFAPKLEGVKAKCTTTNLPAGDRKTIARRLRCTGDGFTYEAVSQVILVEPSRFSIKFQSTAKTQRETGIVSMQADARHLGPCDKL